MSQPRCTRWWCALALVAAAAPAAAQQDQSPVFPHTPTLVASVSLPAPEVLAANRAATPGPARSSTPAPAALTPRPGFPVVGSLYASFVALQVLDVHSTSKALANGAHEANPMLPFAGNTGAMLGVKAASSACTLYIANRVARRNKTAAIVLMAALNSAYSVIVAHNYRLAASTAR